MERPRKQFRSRTKGKTERIWTQRHVPYGNRMTMDERLTRRRRKKMRRGKGRRGEGGEGKRGKTRTKMEGRGGGDEG